jgi:uncharacterized protein involved in response to NO
MTDKHVAPYQIFFPLGIVGALLAVGVWLLQDLHWFETPALLIHSRLIVGGFLWSFITGFLMTAVPRLTGVKPASFAEDGVAAVFVLLSIFCAWRVDQSFYLAQMGLIVFLLIFGGRRLLLMKKKPPVFISHLGLAMLLALGGAFAYYRGHSFLGLHLYHVGAILLLVLGLGTRFFSFLSGLPSEFENESGFWPWVFHGTGVATCVFLLAAGLGWQPAYFALGCFALFYLFWIWRVQRPSVKPSALRWTVRVVATMIPLSFFLCSVWPMEFVTWFHLLFIGCFALMTFSVATRVTLAHGSYAMELENTSKALWVFLGFLLIALLFRVLYGLESGAVRNDFLSVAATFWILAVLSWSFSFFVRIFRKGPQHKPSCR